MSHGHSHDGAPCGGHHGDDGAGGSRPSVNDVQAVSLNFCEIIAKYK